MVMPEKSLTKDGQSPKMQLKQTAIDLDETVYVQYRRLSALDQHVRAAIAVLKNQKSLVSQGTDSPESPWVAAEKLRVKLAEKKETAKLSPTPSPLNQSDIDASDTSVGSQAEEEDQPETVVPETGVQVKPGKPGNRSYWCGGGSSEASESATLSDERSVSNDSESASDDSESSSDDNEWAQDKWLHLSQHSFATGKIRFLVRNLLLVSRPAALRRSLSHGFKEVVTRDCAGDIEITKAVEPAGFPKCPWEQSIYTLEKLTDQLNDSLIWNLPKIFYHIKDNIKDNDQFKKFTEEERFIQFTETACTECHMDWDAEKETRLAWTGIDDREVQEPESYPSCCGKCITQIYELLKNMMLVHPNVDRICWEIKPVKEYKENPFRIMTKHLWWLKYVALQNETQLRIRLLEHVKKKKQVSMLKSEEAKAFLDAQIGSLETVAKKIKTRLGRCAA